MGMATTYDYKPVEHPGSQKAFRSVNQPTSRKAFRSVSQPASWPAREPESQRASQVGVSVYSKAGAWPVCQAN